MPKTISITDSEISEEIRRSPDGIGIEQLVLKFGDRVSRRTLQRRLAELLKRGSITSSGDNRSVRYHGVSQSNEGQATTDPVADSEITIDFQLPLSKEGLELQNYVRRPIQSRTPVGYQSKFLDEYQPGENYYLPKELRDYLMGIGRPEDDKTPAGTYAREILNRLLIDLSWASSRLEGNTYSRLDTKNLIEFGQLAAGKDKFEAQMILNHKNAIEMLVNSVDEVGFNSFTFNNLHALLSENLLSNPEEGGRLRERIVEIGGTVFIPLGIPQRVAENFRAILEKATAIEDPFEQSFFIMVQIPYLQPYIDVNKRVSRLGANISLIRENLCPISFIDVPERAYIDGTLAVYETNRVELLRDVFVWAYERSCQRYAAIRAVVADPDPARIRLREQIGEVVSEIVRSLTKPEKEVVRAVASRLVNETDVEAVVEHALSDLLQLHEGNVARYRLRLSEFNVWKVIRDS